MQETQEEKANSEILESRKDAKDIEAYRGGFGTGSTKEGRIGKKERQQEKDAKWTGSK